MHDGMWWKQVEWGWCAAWRVRGCAGTRARQGMGRTSPGIARAGASHAVEKVFWPNFSSLRTWICQVCWHVLQGTDRSGASSRVRAREERRGMVRESRRGVRCVLLAHEGPWEPRQVPAAWSTTAAPTVEGVTAMSMGVLPPRPPSRPRRVITRGRLLCKLGPLRGLLSATRLG